MIVTSPIRAVSNLRGLAIGIGDPEAKTAEATRKWRGGTLITYATAAGLVGALDEGRIAAAVRGRLEPAETLARLRRAGGGPLAGRAVLLEPRRGQGVLFGPVGVAEGRGPAARTRFAALATAALRKSALATEDPLIAVLSAGRDGDAKRGAHIARSLKGSAQVVAALRRQGLDAFHAGAQVEEVIRDSDVVVAPDGASGNLAFRALHLAAGMKSYGALVLGSPFAFVDTSRSRRSFADPLAFAAYLARVRRRG